MGGNMLSKQKAKDLIVRVFEEEALVIGGLAAMQRVDDDFLWGIMRNLDAILGKAIANLNADDESGKPQSHKQSKVTPHPAIEEFLMKLRRA